MHLKGNTGNAAALHSAAFCFSNTQVQADLSQMQLTQSSERAHAAAAQQQLAGQQQQLERALSGAQAARAGAEARVREAEAKLCDMRAALDSQERLLRVLREQVAEGGMAAARAGDLEAAVQVCGHHKPQPSELTAAACFYEMVLWASPSPQFTIYHFLPGSPTIAALMCAWMCALWACCPNVLKFALPLGYGISRARTNGMFHNTDP